MNININQNLIDTLTRVATSNGRTPEQFVEQQITEILLGRLRADMLRKIETQTVDTAQEIEKAVRAVDTVIAEKNEAIRKSQELTIAGGEMDIK